MKVGDLIEWAGFKGIVTEIVRDTKLSDLPRLRILWFDGGESLMFQDELTRCEDDTD